MGTDSAAKKMSYISSLKNFPLRFRSQKSSDNKRTSAGLSNVREVERSGPISPTSEEELSTETDTVPHAAPPVAPTKLVVRPTVSQSIEETTSEFSDTSTAPHLVYMTSYGGNMNYSLTRAESHIGRKDDNHIILTDATISKFHAIVYRKPDG